MRNAPTLVPVVPSEALGERNVSEVQDLLQQYARTRDLAIRDRLIALHERLVHYLALRLSPGRGTAFEDLVQAGYIGLIKAIDRFDPNYGCQFITFAAPTVAGSMKRYLRDHSWTLKVPRRLCALGISLRRMRQELESELGRTPTVTELAARAEVTEEKVAQALDLEWAYQPLSLDAPLNEHSGGDLGCSWEGIGASDPDLKAVEEKEMLRQALSSLGERHRFIIYRRFFGEASQAEVAAQLGVSQMQVSRLERQALSRLREMLA